MLGKARNRDHSFPEQDSPDSRQRCTREENRRVFCRGRPITVDEDRDSGH